MRRLLDNLIWALLLLALGASVLHGETIRLKPSAQVIGQDVRLMDVAELSGADVEALAARSVMTLTGDEATLTLAALRETLSQGPSLNWATVTLTGHAACHVRRLSATAPQVPTLQPATALQEEIVGPKVRDVVEAHLARQTQRPLAELRVTYQGGDELFLREPVGGDEILVEPLNDAQLGRLVLNVKRYREGAAMVTQRLSVHVALPMQAVVATRSVRPRQVITPEDIELRPVFIESDDAQPVAGVEELLGMEAARALREGAMVDRVDVRPPALVRRGELISVLARVGELSVRTHARASADGVLGELIEARNQQSGQSLMVRVTGPGEATLDPIAPASAASPAEERIAQR